MACVTRYWAIISLALLFSLPGTAQELEHRTITSNLEYRLTWGDLPRLLFGVEKAKNVEVTAGAEELLIVMPLRSRAAARTGRPPCTSSFGESRINHSRLGYISTDTELKPREAAWASGRFCITRSHFRTMTRIGCMKIWSGLFRSRWGPIRIRRRRLRRGIGSHCSPTKP